MGTVFLSYSRKSAAASETLAADIQTLGHTVWMDRELSGGQSWWDKILDKVQDCDIFVFALTPEALNSIACQRECEYAAALGKPILPIVVSDGVSANLLPPALSKIQFVDYKNPDREAAFHLARAFTTLPAAAPLPDPLPPRPEVPMSYLGGLAERLASKPILNYEEQSGLVFDLKAGLRDPETMNDALELLRRLRKRRDLLAGIAEEIDELLESEKTKEQQPSPDAFSAAPKTLTLLSVAQVLDRERPRSDGGDLREGDVVVVDLHPMGDAEFGALVRRNLDCGISYHYFLKISDDNVNKTCQFLQLILADRSTAGKASDFQQRLEVVKREKVRILEDLRQICIRGGLRISLLPEEPTFRFRIHNASDAEFARAYLNYDGRGFVPWAEGMNAVKLWSVMPGYLPTEADERIFVPLRHFDLQGAQKEYFNASLDRALKRYFPGLEDEVKRLCVGSEL